MKRKIAAIMAGIVLISSLNIPVWAEEVSENEVVSQEMDDEALAGIEEVSGIADEEVILNEPVETNEISEEDYVVENEVSVEDKHVFNKHTYEVYDVYKTWEEAKIFCEEQGGHLATITSSEEQAYIELLLSNKRRTIYYLGATDAEKEGEWKWITGETWSYTNWHSEAPDNFANNEDYLNIYNIPKYNGQRHKWNDICNKGYYSNDLNMLWESPDRVGFICEWDNDTSGNENKGCSVSTTDCLRIGDVIELGRYNDEKITWKCVAITSNGPLMVSEKVITFKEYDAAGVCDLHYIKGSAFSTVRYEKGSNCWQDSNLRQWMNSSDNVVNYSHIQPSYKDEEGFLCSFTSEELEVVKEVNHLVHINCGEYEYRKGVYLDGGKYSMTTLSLDFASDTNYEDYYYKKCKDRMFLLNAEEVNLLKKNCPDFLFTEATDGATNYATTMSYKNVKVPYWTGSASNTGYSHEWVQVVTNSGVSGKEAYDRRVGVRPAFYFNYEDKSKDNWGFEIRKLPMSYSRDFYPGHEDCKNVREPRNGVGTVFVPFGYKYLFDNSKNYNKDLALLGNVLSKEAYMYDDVFNETKSKEDNPTKMKAVYEKLGIDGGFDISPNLTDDGIWDKDRGLNIEDILFRYKTLKAFTDYQRREVYALVSHPLGYYGYKKVSINGEECNLWFVTLRGSTSSVDWLSDVIDGSENFMKSAANTKKDLQKFMQNMEKENKCDLSKRNIFYMTGHSYGASTANRLSIMLGEYANPDDIYTYTFESPHTCGMNDKLSYYSNAYNIINICDYVPRLPVYEGATTFGNNLFFFHPNIDKTTFATQSGGCPLDCVGWWGAGGIGSHSLDLDLASLQSDYNYDTWLYAKICEDLSNNLVIKAISADGQTLDFFVSLFGIDASTVVGVLADSGVVEKIEAAQDVIFAFSLIKNSCKLVGKYFLHIGCPVDVAVYEGDTLLCETIDDVAYNYNDDIARIAVLEEDKFILSSKDDIKIIIKGTDEGQMNISAFTIEDTCSNLISNYSDIEIKQEKKFELELLSDNENVYGTSAYVIDDNREILLAVSSNGLELPVRKLSYDINGGLGQIPVDDNVYVENDEVKVKKGTGLFRKGYRFAGWTSSKDGSGEIYNEDDIFNIHSDTVLYAKWTPNDYIIEYILNKDVKGTVKDLFFRMDEEATLSDGSTISCEGKILQGWSVSNNQAVAQFEIGEKASKVVSTLDACETAPNKIKLYAVWSDDPAYVKPDPEPTTVAVTGITLNKSRVELKEKETYTLTTEVAPADATDKSVIYESANILVATVSANGKITAVGEGSTTITVKSVSNPEVKVECTVIVTKKAGDPEPSNPTEPSDPTDPSNPIDPSDPSNPADPDVPVEPTKVIKMIGSTGYKVEYIRSVSYNGVAHIEKGGKTSATKTGDIELTLYDPSGEIVDSSLYKIKFKNNRDNAHVKNKQPYFNIKLNSKVDKSVKDAFKRTNIVFDINPCDLNTVTLNTPVIKEMKNGYKVSKLQFTNETGKIIKLKQANAKGKGDFKVSTDDNSNLILEGIGNYTGKIKIKP